MAKTGLVVSAHPGDFVWRAGGAIALHAKKGYRVKIVCLAFGERGESQFAWKQPGMTLEKVKAGRRDEAERAAAALGAEIEFFDAGDYPLHLNEAHMERLIDIYRELNPSFVLTHSLEDPYNVDHPAAAAYAQEARIVARRILADGHRRGVALVPRGDWGNRVIDAFTRELTAGGGSLITQALYDPAEHDYSYELTAILHVDDSDARHVRLQNVLGTKLNFEPRHRADIEFVFIVPASATNARLIQPQLKFFYAGDVPSYSLSNAYEPDSTASNQDIDGLMYPDMPWMITGDGSIDAIRSSISQVWENRAAWRSRLFAFGYDACQLMLAMSAKGRSPADAQVAGLTGVLHFDTDRRVQRDLIWVQVHNGEPRRLADSTPQ